MSKSSWNRRGFLKVLGASAASGVSLKAFGQEMPFVALLTDPTDPVAGAAPAKRAIKRLEQAFESHRIPVQFTDPPQRGTARPLRIFVAGAQHPSLAPMLRDARASIPATPESLGIVVDPSRPALIVCGHDVRGLIYALTDLADLIRNSRDAMAAVGRLTTTVEQPANHVRSMMRLFTSEVEDKPWYNDRAMWPEYFDTLVAQRFNRFQLAFGIGYDFIRNVTDAYFLFTYPFLLDVPGYNVRVPQLPSQERDRNLEMLKTIGEQCVASGLQFHVGLWMHGYEWIDSPNANYTIEGLNRTNHGPYCRDALRMLLHQVPTISGITFRVHGESGVAEGSFDFWKTVFDGAATCGRTVEIDMHAKGMSQSMIDIALAPKLPVTISPKFWGEHMGMPYHQADIRKIEKPKTENAKGLLALSSGTRSFLRYGYGDLLREDRRWKVVHRIWPGTQRLLLWGDPEFASAYSRAFSFCGSDGVEIMEPLSFKGRRGSGHAGNRCAYTDQSLVPRWDWQKYDYTTRVWGRMLYNPGTQPEILRRPLVQHFGRAATAVETALANVSRILPIITTAYGPSAANNLYWPEMYVNQSMVDADHYEPYSDTLPPRVFGNASAFDPELFLSANLSAQELLEAKPTGKYTPIDASQWIEDFAAAARAALAEAERTAVTRDTAEFRRAKIDIEIQAALGEFFAAKFRSGVLFHLYEITRNPAALSSAIDQYRKARASYAAAVGAAKGAYMDDITFGEQSWLRGHWLDRLPAIDKDIAALSAMLTAAAPQEATPQLAAAIKAALGKPLRTELRVEHQPPPRFHPGQELRLAISAPADIREVLLHYRRVDQAENFSTIAMKKAPSGFSGTIPADYTRTAFPLEYYFEVHKTDRTANLYPGFSPALTNQPYFVVQRS